MREGPSGTAPREQLVRAAIEHFADHGVTNQSLRGIATALGTSHRMLIYHFGSREGLLAGVVAAVEQQERDVLTHLVDGMDDEPPRELALRFWALVVEPALRYGPLFFELSAHAMQDQPHASTLRQTLVDPWLGPLTTIMERAGHSPARARTHARLGLAVARGLLFDLLVSGQRAEVDAAMELFVDLAEADQP